MDCNDKTNKNCLKGSCFFNLPAKQFSLLSSIIGIILIDNLDIDQQDALGNFLTNIGQNISTSAAQETVLNSNDNQDNEIEAQLEILKNHICLLEKQAKKR
ncbi:hypothetical protein [Metaclostridioides mangenotii]|uniref:Uncharacterized protein n=1 Tax=Metaclostridioides mangenotii TaxID=1540 RepID=A0ABS4EBY7_9FIRM|nr:hypothetical protein [Clostridioides mangenotii]MBP1855446.1 hypothetical protein [Clostridioides mangenotii]